MLRHGMNVHETTINRKTQKNIISDTESAYGNTSFHRRKHFNTIWCSSCISVTQDRQGNTPT